MSTAHGLPTPPTPIIGRSDELAAVCDMVLAPGTRLVTVTGSPGVGKTRLTIEVATALAERFADGAVWIDLSRVGDPALLLPEITAAVEGEHAAGREPRRAVRGDLLLVLDNCEHLLTAMPQLGGLLADTPWLRVLATSRERLRLQAEREFVLQPLPMPSQDDVADLRRLAGNAAVALLLARAPGSIALTTQTARSIVDVCVRLDGLPLALELAGARLRVFTPGELAFRLGRRMDVLTTAARDSPPRHRDLRSALAWSHDLLPDSERIVFRRLSVMVGDWTLGAADEVCGDDVETSIESLVDKSLVHRVAAAGSVARFRMLASVREFAAEQLEAHGEVADTQLRHTAYVASEARRWESTAGTEREGEGWADLGHIYADLRSAFAFNSVARDPDATLWLATGLGWHAYTRGMLASCGPLVDVVHASVDRSDDWQVVAAALIAAGILQLSAGEIDGAEPDLQRAARLSEASGDERRLAISSAFLGHVARAQRRFEDAAARYAMAREIFGRLGHLRGTAWAEHDLGLLAFVRGQWSEAESSLREALRLFRDLEYDWATAVSACALADVLRNAGAIDEPTALYGEALGLHDSVGDQRGVAQCVEGLADVSLSRGAAETAARLRGAALQLRDGAGAVPSEWEQARLDRLDAAAVSALGRADADHAQHSGRAMSSRSAIRLATEAASMVPATSAAPDVELTGRQLEVAGLVAAGRTNRQIGRTLGISEKTVEVHVRNIMDRLQTPSRASIAAWAIGHGVRPDSST